MVVRWYGQSAFLLEARRRVLLDPFGAVRGAFASRGLEFRYPPIAAVSADLVLVTHEHADHNAVEVARRRDARDPLDRGDARLAGGRGRGDRLRARRRRRHRARAEHDLLLLARRPPHLPPGRLRPARAAARSSGRRSATPTSSSSRSEAARRSAGAAAADARPLDRPAPRRPYALPHRGVNFLDPPDAFLDALGAEVVRRERKRGRRSRACSARTRHRSSSCLRLRSHDDAGGVPDRRGCGAGGRHDAHDPLLRAQLRPVRHRPRAREGHASGLYGEADVARLEELIAICATCSASPSAASSSRPESPFRGPIADSGRMGSACRPTGTRGSSGWSGGSGRGHGVGPPRSRSAPCSASPAWGSASSSTSSPPEPRTPSSSGPSRSPWCWAACPPPSPRRSSAGASARSSSRTRTGSPSSSTGTSSCGGRPRSSPRPSSSAWAGRCAAATSGPRWRRSRRNARAVGSRRSRS